MRLKYEALLIQGQMVRTKIYDRMNERHWVGMKNTKILYEALFAKWKKKEYNAAMTMVYQVKSYYETTDKLKQEYRNLERELMMLNMDIVFIEGHWIRCIMLQNFHYLMGDQDWRAERDWIHLVPKSERRGSSEGQVDEEQCPEHAAKEVDVGDEDLELEPYDVSIAKRTTVNIRVRDKDDAWPSAPSTTTSTCKRSTQSCKSSLTQSPSCRASRALRTKPLCCFWKCTSQCPFTPSCRADWRPL